MKRYPITIDFDTKYVGYVELEDNVSFTLSNVLVPSIAIDYKDPASGKKKEIQLLEFGLIHKDKVLKDPEKLYGNVDSIKDKNANV